MTRIPEPTDTPDGPAYEGRLLDRPTEEVVDQGAGFDITTLVTRRRVLSIVGAGAGALALAACSSTASSGMTAPKLSEIVCASRAHSLATLLLRHLLRNFPIKSCELF